jgi:K+-transporting ATPase KdpF subunit
MSLDLTLGALIAAALFALFLVALLRPERF